ncbi:putative oxidoreductase [Paraburkholderia sp. WC7.3g]
MRTYNWEPARMTRKSQSALRGPTLNDRILRVIGWLERVPYAVLALPLRFAVATVFWNSATTKLADWNAALELFKEDYRLPLLAPEVAAYVAVSIELTTPVLLVLGLATRPVAFVLLGMTTVIEVFVYPLAWPTHIQWAAMLLVLLCRGAGNWSVDHLLYRRFSTVSSNGSSRPAD